MVLAWRLVENDVFLCYLRFNVNICHVSCLTLRWFVWYKHAESSSVRIVVVSRPFVFTDEQMLRRGRCHCRLVTVARVCGWSRSVIRTSSDHFLHMFWLDVDWHCTDDAALWWTGCRLETHWASVSHTHVQLSQHLRILHSRTYTISALIS